MYSLIYEKHSYKRNSIVKKDYDSNNITLEKLKDINYFKGFLK